MSPLALAAALAITFDDLPAHGPLPPGETRLGVAEKLIAALKDAHAPPVYGFVNGKRVEEDPSSGAALKAWRAAGYPLANHTWSHPNLNQVTAADFEADLARNEAVLERHMPAGGWRWLRYPFLAEGDDPAKRAEVRGFLAGRGYRIAAVTMTFHDYRFNEPYARCAAKGDMAAIAQLEQAYLQAAADGIEDVRAMAKAAVGRDIPYVLLMHAGAFDARMLPRLLDLYRRRGFTLVTLEKAEADSFYASARDPARTEPDSLDGAMILRGLPARSRPAPPIDQLCR